MLVLDENGKLIDTLAERNEEIKQKLEPVLKDFLQEKREMLVLKKPIKLGFRFSKQLWQVLSEYGQMSAEDVARLDYETLNDYWLKYLSLTAHYNRYFELVDNKQLFMVFMGINDRIWKHLANHDDEDIRNLICTMNSAFTGLGFIATESGNSDTKATNSRLGAKGVGHDMVSATEEMIAQAVTSRTPNELNKEIDRYLGGKLLGSNKKL